MVYFDKDLKPCPFCGGKAERGFSFSGGNYTRCSGCSATLWSVPSNTSEELWNARTQDAQLKVAMDVIKSLDITIECALEAFEHSQQYQMFSELISRRKQQANEALEKMKQMGGGE